jgi:hypothetical protein
MPAWLIPIVVQTAVALGGMGLHWLVTKFPGLPPQIATIIEDLIAQIGGHITTATAAAQAAVKK